MTEDRTIVPTIYESFEMQRLRADEEKQRAEAEKRRADEAESKLQEQRRMTEKLLEEYRRRFGEL